MQENQIYNEKIVVLTGSGGSFGNFLAKKLLLETNVKVILLTSDPDRVKVSRVLNPIIYKVELSNSISVKNIFRDIYEEHGDMDVLINNAAITTTKGFHDFLQNSDDNRTKDYYSVNCAGSLYCIKYFLKEGKASGKKIINVLAGRALTGHLRHVGYYSSKAALYNATLTLANDYPNHYFRNIMTGRIDLGGGGDNPESIWSFFKHFINEKNPKQYREVYFRNRFEFYRKLLGYYLNHFRSCERRNVRRN